MGGPSKNDFLLRLPLLTWKNPRIGACCSQHKQPDWISSNPVVKIDIHWNTKEYRKVVEWSDTGKSVAEVALDVDITGGSIGEGQAVAGEQVEQGHLQGAVEE